MEMDKNERPLRENFPKLLKKLPWLSLGDFPTPIHRLDNLGAQLYRANLYVKRDDVSSSLYAGNKVRKLEFLLGWAKQKGVKTLVTMGASGSNHVLATALHGQRLGFRTVGVVFRQPMTETVQKNMLAGAGANVEMIFSPSKYLLPVVAANVMRKIRHKEGKSPLLIPAGGSSALGALGFVNAGLELSTQIKTSHLPEPKAVFVAYGTGGTAAGLAVGFQLAGMSTRVMAVRVIDRLLANRIRLLSQCRAIVNLLQSAGDEGIAVEEPGTNLHVVQDCFGNGYGIPTEEALNAIRLFSDLEAITLEGTYTGKAVAAFLRTSLITKEPLLYWNTFSGADLCSWIEKGKRLGFREKTFF